MTRIYGEEGVAGGKGGLIPRSEDSYHLELVLSGELIRLALERRISWQEAHYALNAIAYYDEREERNWRRRQEIIAEGGLE